MTFSIRLICLIHVLILVRGWVLRVVELIDELEEKGILTNILRELLPNKRRVRPHLDNIGDTPRTFNDRSISAQILK